MCKYEGKGHSATGRVRMLCTIYLLFLNLSLYYANVLNGMFCRKRVSGLSSDNRSCYPASNTFVIQNVARNLGLSGGSASPKLGPCWNLNLPHVGRVNGNNILRSTGAAGHIQPLIFSGHHAATLLLCKLHSLQVNLQGSGLSFQRCASGYPHDVRSSRSDSPKG